MPTASFKEISPPKLSISDGKETRTREFRCDWPEIEDNIEELFPSSFQAGLELVRKSPATYPGKDYLRLVSIDVAPQDGDRVDAEDEDGVVTSASGALLTLKYSTHIRDIFSINIETSAEFMRLPGQGPMTWEYTVDGKNKMSMDAVSHKLIPQITYTVTMLRVPQPHWDNIEDAIGTINNGYFLNCESGTLMYLGCSVKEVVTPDGEVAYDMGHKFQKRKIRYSGPGGAESYAGWNHLYRPDVYDTNAHHQWQRTTPRIYAETNFVKIFQQGEVDLRGLFIADLDLGTQ